MHPAWALCHALSMMSAPAMGVLERVEERTDEIVRALDAACEAAIVAPSLLEGWSRLTIACHLRYGARACVAMTGGSLHGRLVSFYPPGRVSQRPATLVPDDGETPDAVVASLAASSDALHEGWSKLHASDWTLAVLEPDCVDRLDCRTLIGLVLLRLTELEVHGADLDLGLSPWSSVFGPAVLPQRLRRLRALPASPARTWLFHADDAESHLLRTDSDGTVLDRSALGSNPCVRADIELGATANDLVAVLLGRAPVDSVDVSGRHASCLSPGLQLQGP